LRGSSLVRIPCLPIRKRLKRSIKRDDGKMDPHPKIFPLGALPYPDL